MAIQYRYKGRSADGQLLTGKVWGENETSALKSISNKGISILSITVLEKPFKKGWKSIEIAHLFQHIHTLLKSGYTIVNAIKFLMNHHKNKQMKLILQQIYNDLVAGKSFYEALKKVQMHEMVLRWVYIAENAGELEEPFLEIANYYKSKHDLIKKVVAALAYPVFMFILSIILFIFCTVVFIPKFFPLYEGFGIEPPAFVVGLASTGLFLQLYGMYLITFFIVFLAVAYLFRKKTIELMQKVLYKVPLFTKMRQANIFLLLSIMANSGVGIYDAIRLIKNGTSNKEDQLLYSSWLDKIKQGSSLSGLCESAQFDPMYIQMIKIGESSGRLGEMLNRASENAEEVVKETVNKYVAVLQPLLLLVLGVIVGVMVYSIMLPVSSVLNTV